MSNLRDFFDLADGFIKFFGFVSIAYVISIGLAHRSGAKSGEKIFQRRRQREGKPAFKELLTEERHPPFWRDEKLIHGGLKAFQWLALLLAYVLMGVLVTLLLFPPSIHVIMVALITLLFFPTSVAAIFICAVTLFFKAKRETTAALWILTVISIAAAVVSFIISDRDKFGYYELSIHGAVLFIQSFFLAYFIGVIEGTHEADLEQRLPLVEVTTRTGVVNGVRMRGSSKGGYRFIAADGSELLIPAAQVRSIRTADSAADKGAPKP